MCSVLFSNKERQTAFRIQTDKLLEALTRRRSSHGITPVKAAPAPLRCAPFVNANVILHNSGEENMHDSGEKSLWVSFK